MPWKRSNFCGAEIMVTDRRKNVHFALEKVEFLWGQNYGYYGQKNVHFALEKVEFLWGQNCYTVTLENCCEVPKK